MADAVGSTPASVNSALQRARKAVDERVPDRSQLAIARALGDERVQEIVQRLGDAFERGDTGAILALLTEDATFSMPPYTSRCRGREAIADSWLDAWEAAPALALPPYASKRSAGGGCVRAEPGR